MNGYCDVYKHSGKIGPAAYMVPVAGIISAIILSFIYALFNQNGNTEIELRILGMFISPGVIWDLIQSTNETGWYSILSWTPSGSALWTFWGIEAIIIVAVPLIISSKVIDSEMFCEKCSDWCVSVESLGLAIPDDDELLKEIKKGDAESLADLDRAP